MGIVYALDRDSGELVWKTPVGTHNGHDDDGAAQLEALDLPEFHSTSTRDRTEASRPTWP